VFYDEVTAEVPVSGRTDLLQARVSYQGCKENSICYPPQTVVLTIDTDVATVPTPPDTVSEQDEFASRMASGSLPFVMLLSFLAGLAMSLLPCCWPMIPILSGIIVGQGNAITTGRAFALSATYVLGMAVVYAAAGAVAAAAGQQVQSAMQTPWIIGGVALIFVAMALSMFGLYELQLPAALTNRFNAASERQRTGTWIGTALMGALSALVVSACVAPPLVGVLTFIAQTGDVLRGAMALFSMAIGMGVPLLVLGASGGRLLPKAGPWMENVKAAFGFVMLGLAIWMLDRILSDRMTMLLWAALLFGAGIYLGAFRRLAPATAPTRKLARGVGLLAIIYGVALLAGAYSGSGNPLQPLGFLSRGHSTGETAALPFRRIKTLADLDGAIAAATADGKPVMLDFYADWCTSCIEMEHYTFNTPQVRAALDGVVLLQADVTANDTDDRALLNRFGIFGPPTIVFFGVDGQERQGSRIVGYQDADRFAAHVRQATGP
jgi:thiol:disulfide interchange protein DsbD